jgi:hypothetical protein
MTIVQRQARWLQENVGAFCDDCIARELGLPGRRQANRASTALAAVGVFYRDTGACSICGAQRKVIQAL